MVFNPSVLVPLKIIFSSQHHFVWIQGYLTGIPKSAMQNCCIMKLANYWPLVVDDDKTWSCRVSLQCWLLEVQGRQTNFPKNNYFLLSSLSEINTFVDWFLATIFHVFLTSFLKLLGSLKLFKKQKFGKNAFLFLVASLSITITCVHDSICSFCLQSWGQFFVFIVTD